MLTAKFGELLPHLDERAQRLVLGAEARALGHGGIGVVAETAGVSRGRVSRGAREVAAGVELWSVPAFLDTGFRLPID